MPARSDESTPSRAPAETGSTTPTSGPPRDAGISRSSGSFPSTGSRRFGKYQLLTELGRGGMATVYLAVSHAGIQEVRRPVVVKLLDDNLRTDAEFVKMFARESKIAIELSHPNVVLTHTVGQEAGRYYIAMEYLEGVTLREIMSRASEWPLQDRLPLFGAMCLLLTGLGYVHEFQDHRGEHLGLVHRDIKPDNIFITTTGQVKLLDFGVAKAALAGFEATLGVAVRGTVQYLPPESVKGDETVDHRWDLFSAGIILAELATGRRYWDGVPYPQILTRLAADELPNLVPAHDEEVPPPFARLLERALHPEPAARFQSALELRRALQSVLARQGHRINSSDLARIVSHLYEPIRKQREELIRSGLEDIERDRVPAGTWSVGDTDTSGQHVPTPPTTHRPEATSPAVGSDDAPSPTPAAARPRWHVPAALVAIALLVVIAWRLQPQSDAEVSSARAELARVESSPREPTPREPAAARAPASAPAVQEAAPPSAVPPVEPTPPAPTPEEPAPATPPATSSPEPASVAREPMPSTSRGKSRRSKKQKDASTAAASAATSEDAKSDPPSKPPAGKKLELEPSPYTR